jgi:lipid II:glycine glycyltransferase (peptidoglycan interpeptide bridge formation enzyme)
MLDLFDDANIYQTAAYGAVRWGQKSLSRIVLKQNGEIVGVAQLRIIRPTPLKFGMAYLRWGPLWERRGQPHDPEVPIRLAHAIQDEYVLKRKLLVRIIPNAFAGSPRAAAMQAAFTEFSAEIPDEHNGYRTFVLDLTPSLEQLRKNFDPKWRNKLAGAEKNKLTVAAGSGKLEYQAFCQMYNEMRNRKSFETTVNVKEFGQIQESLSNSHRMQILICRDGDLPVAGLIVSSMGDSAIYLLGATSDEGLKSKGAYLLHWTMIRYLKESGTRWYDLGGVDPELNPGVYTFKKGFSGVDVCQIRPFVASASALSSGLVKAGLALQRTLKSSLSPFVLARSLKQLAARI